MLKLGILRSPTGHSLSSIMQTAALKHLNIKGEYNSYGINPEQLDKEFTDLKKSGIIGLNVTMPHKITIIKYLDELTETAQLIGAVNTITIKNGKSIGDNTDIVGFWNAIPLNIQEKLQGSNVAIVGNGGAACAIVIALIKNNVKSLTIYGRDKNKLLGFSLFCNQKKDILRKQTEISVDLISNINLKNISMLVNTIPIGMYPNIKESSIEKDKLIHLPNESLVYDIIYNPLETILLKDAKSLNKQTLNGVDMLVLQGAASLNIWLEQDIAPIDVMRKAILEYLRTNT